MQFFMYILLLGPRFFKSLGLERARLNHKSNLYLSSPISGCILGTGTAILRHHESLPSVESILAKRNKMLLLKVMSQRGRSKRTFKTKRCGVSRDKQYKQAKPDKRCFLSINLCNRPSR